MRRRRLVIGSALLLPGLAQAAAPAIAARLAELEALSGGELGVCALDSGSGQLIGHKAEQRFAMCSTFKALLAGQVLARVEAGALSLAQQLPVKRADLLPHAPAVEAKLKDGRMTVAELCAGSVELSDNAAANLLLSLCGGPKALTAWLRDIGDPLTRLDRSEPELNSNIPGDPRDSTTPAAMAETLRRLLLGEQALRRAESRAQLLGWMERSPTGRARLRAGLPAGWRAGDKTGTGTRGAVNDVAIVFPPGRAPWLIAVYMSGSAQPVGELSRLHELVMRALLPALQAPS
ncbi:class A beta-lactamase [Roseateles violae]|uniref:Beta-lactamase n=1 Tax=Roseateles violae TaxID=3058042 RepID=A0ABT8DV93_9BURK|nr:class A beta-lactamase [Pelomonas sp. PFR6]MDN3921918.1 class A beta-lactamase [Pelomonas sp. PFR6]